MKKLIYSLLLAVMLASLAGVTLSFADDPLPTTTVIYPVPPPPPDEF